MNNNVDEGNYVVCKVTSADTKYDGLTVVLSLDDFINSLEGTDFAERLNKPTTHHRIQEF
jgi:hypothetical protein